MKKYDHIRITLNKFARGGRIPKYDRGSTIQRLVANGYSQADAEAMYDAEIGVTGTEDAETALITQMGVLGKGPKDTTIKLKDKELNDDAGLTQEKNKFEIQSPSDWNSFFNGLVQQRKDEAEDSPTYNPDDFQFTPEKKSRIGKTEVQNALAASFNTSSPTAADAAGDIMKAAKSGGSPMAAISSTFGAALGVADKALMGDKKFNEQGQAMDDAANGLANVASQFGPWGQAAAMAIRAANFADKAAGQTVPGYDVNLESSGFSGVNAHGDTASLRLTQSRNVDKMLGRQQQQVQMALAAAQLDKDNSLQQEARGASVQDIINRNQIALAGGLGTTTLGA